MDRFRILNSRKRAIIALVHSIAFGLLASYQLAIHHHPSALIAATRGHIAVPAILSATYLIVSAVLVFLLYASRTPLERLYFAFCATSACTGLARVIFGDPTFYAGNLLRVSMLGCAVITGVYILRLHAEPEAQFAR